MARSVAEGRPRPGVRFHPLVWPIWLLAGALAVGSNPLHNLLLLCAAVFVALVCERDSPVGRALSFFVRIGLVLIVVRVILSAISVGGFAFGATPLGRLPFVQLPWWLGGLALGGPFTFEMLMVGFVGGMQLLTLLALFGTFNAVADHYGLLRRAPSFLGGAGLAVTIALVFVPQTLQQLVAIREAQQVRGHRFRGWCDALPLLVPLIVGGLERSLHLAEAMDSRGYGGVALGRNAPGEQFVLLIGASLTSIGVFLLFYQASLAIALSVLAVGGVLLGWILSIRQRVQRRTRYLRERWRTHDVLAIASSLILFVAAPLTRHIAPAALLYTPFPRAVVPSVAPESIVIMLLLIVPAGITAAEEWRRERTARQAHDAT